MTVEQLFGYVLEGEGLDFLRESLTWVWQQLMEAEVERVNREIGRRSDVVGIFPSDRVLIRLAASVVIEQNDEWLAQALPLSSLAGSSAL